MSNSFEEIQRKIKEDLESKAQGRPAEEQEETEAPEQPAPDPQGKAYVTPTVSRVTSPVVSKPGTEVIRLDTNQIQWMECDAAGDIKKHRYCLVFKNETPKFSSQFTNAEGWLVNVVTEAVFMATLGLMRGVVKQITELKQSLKTAETERDAYKLTIDALKKHNIID